MLPLPNLLDLAVGASLEDVAAARQDLADYTATGEIDTPTREAYLAHLDMIESAARITCALI